jgi:hypothetical protein
MKKSEHERKKHKELTELNIETLPKANEQCEKRKESQQLRRSTEEYKAQQQERNEQLERKSTKQLLKLRAAVRTSLLIHNIQMHLFPKMNLHA